MIQNLPSFISILFILTTLLTLVLFYRSIPSRKQANIILPCLVIWLSLQAIASLKGLYSANTNALPPRIMPFAILPPIITIILLFATSNGRKFIDSLSLANLTWLHIVRIPVEVVLWQLFLYKAVPQLMTFEGRNYDILSGITAPFIAYYGIRKARLGKPILLIWNLACLALLFNIVISALLSAPSPLQKLAFDQPNIAILYFPVSWLPAFIVPVVLFSHLTAIRKLLTRTTTHPSAN